MKPPEPSDDEREATDAASRDSGHQEHPDGTRDSAHLSSHDDADWFAALVPYRVALGDWEREPPDPDGHADPDWKKDIQWDQLSDDEVSKIIPERSNPAMEARLRRLWGAIGEAVAADSTLRGLHDKTHLIAFHNGCPFEARSIPRPNGWDIWINDAIADLAKSVALGLGAWMEAERTVNPKQELSEWEQELSEWAKAEPVIRRVVQFEGIALTDGSELWQPFDITAPREVRLAASYASEWAILFWIGHEFAHIVQQKLTEPTDLRIGERSIRCEPGIPQCELEIACDSLGMVIAIEACRNLDYWPDFLQNQYCLTVTFLAVIYAELRYYIRPGRNTRRFTSRLFPAIDALNRLVEPSTLQPALLVRHYLHVLLATDTPSSYTPILTLIEDCPFVKVTDSQVNRPERLDQIALHDLVTRLWCASTARVQLCIAVATLLDATSLGDELSSLLDSLDLPPYDETIFSRTVYTKIESVRNSIGTMVKELPPDTRRRILDPPSKLTFASWETILREVEPQLTHPLILRVLHEIASDRGPLIRDNITDDENP